MASRSLRFFTLCTAMLAAFHRHALADKMTWAPCDEGLTAFTPNSVSLSPDPPVIGSAAVFVITGDIESDLQGGSVDMVISIAGFPIYSSSSDLCTKTTCPVPAGPFSLTLEELLPPIAPPGDYGLQVVARGPNGAELACVNVNFSLILPSATATITATATAMAAGSDAADVSTAGTAATAGARARHDTGLAYSANTATQGLMVVESNTLHRKEADNDEEQGKIGAILYRRNLRNRSRTSRRSSV